MVNSIILFFSLASILKLCIFLENEHNPHMSGFYTDGLNQTIDKIEIVYPEKVSKDGSFVSYYLPQYYNVESLENRPKRSRDSIEHTDGDAIHFFVPIEGEKHQLELWPNLNFFSPELVVERRDVQDIENVNKAKMSQISQRQCHYSGRIVGKPASRAAVSTCYGLTGYIQLPFGEEYLIEPVKDFKPAYNKEHPHIMYKRSGIKDHHGTSNCLTKGSAKDALGERLKWESMFGSQLKRDFSALNMNDVMREETTKPPVANIQPNMVLKKENLKSFGNFKRVYQQNEIIAEENMHLKNNSQNHEFPQQNSDKVKNEYGNKLKSKPLREELGRIQIPDVNILPQKLSSSQTISGQHLLTKTDAESYENAKGPYKNYLKPRRVKRELTDQDQDIAQTRDSSKTRLNQMSNDEQIHNNCTEFQSYDIKQENSLKPIRNTEDEKARFLSQSEQKIEMSNTCSEHKVPSSDVHLKKTCNNGMNDREMNDFNNIKVKVDSLKSNDVENCNSPVNGNKVNTDLTNNQKYPHPNIEKNAKRDIHLDTSEKSWKSYEKGEASYAAETPTHNTDKKTRLDGEVTNKKSSQLYKKTKQNNENMYNNNRKVNTLDPVKDMDKTKVKKDIGGGLLYVPQQEKNYNTQFVANKPLDKDKHSNYNKHDETLSDIENENVYKIVVEDGNLKDDLGSTKENKQNVDLIDEPFQPAENSTNTHADEIVIRIKTPEGTISEVKPNQDINSGRLKYSVINPTTNNEHIDSVLDQNIGMFLTKNNLKRNNVEKNKRGTTEIFETDSQGGSYVQDTRNADKGISSQDFNIVVEDAENGNIVGNYASNKAKRDDNTIHLVIETEPEVKSQEVHDSEHPASNLFCQGRNCLEIKPIFLNDTKSSLTSSNSTSDNPKEKVIKKRDSEEDGFCGSSTTEAPLRCNDFNHKIFTIELMITVDYKVVHMHEDDDIENFILTIINMVSSNFNDKSLGLNLNVVLVRLILLTTCIKELDSDRFNPEELLENFCTWQVLVNPGRDDHPHHHDLAIFVSKMDKCQGQTMGVSYMTSVCRPDKACIVCVDEGLLLANTITHLIGHSLGADHDDGQSSGCGESLPDGTTYHMAPTITETSSAWSVCSRDAITQFVQTQGSWCLIDFPVVRTYNFPLMLPGQIYSAAQQCKLNFHMSAVPCSVGAFCNKLYCQITDKLCATKGDPPADGTFCASDMWCFHKQCVHVGRRPGAINGEWGPWTEWSLCTRSCGGGVSSSYRICNNPKPQNGGRYCIGERIRHKICETKPCQGFTESFRDLQCKRTEDRPFRGKLHNWVQYESLFINIECALVCQNRKGDVVMRSPIVADGTPCKAGTKNVCIQGMCRNVGCDYMIDSTAREDACGVCHGNGTECRIVGGVFDEAISKKGLIEFLRIPKDSGMIFVREIAPSSNTLVVSGSINRVFYLNGLGSDDSMAGDVAFGLSHGVYEKRGGMERIFIRGPTTEDLIFYIFFRDINKGVHYQYAILEYDPTYIPRYLWQYLDWDACSDPCSGGSQRARAKCVEDRGGVVDDKYCTESSRPLDIVRPCNDFPCQAKWWVSVWSDCICTGATSVMFRSVLCMRANDESGTRVEVVKESECTLAEKPPTQKPCNYSEEDTECAKRSVVDDSFYQSRRELRRSVNPRLAFSAVSPVDSEQLNQDKDNDRKNVSADICVTTEVPSVCPTEEITSETPSTCKETSAPQPHKKTTCCRTTPHRQFVVKTTFETTTIRPVAVKLDQLNINNFGLTVVPLEYSGKKKLLPLSDPEFINLGNVGQFGIADELNATVISGQEALDLLEFARSNASEEPIVLHEDMHN